MTTTIVFKLTNGETIKCDFNVTDKLKEVKEFINKNRTDEKRPFELMIAYPKHTFTDVEYELTLSQLNLFPSSTITLNPLDVSSRIQKKSSQSAKIHPPGSTTPDSKPKKSKSKSSDTKTESHVNEDGEEVVTKKEKTSVFSSIKNGLTGGLFGAVEHTKKQQELQDQKDGNTSSSPQLKSDKDSKPTLSYGGVSGHISTNSPISKRSK